MTVKYNQSTSPLNQAAWILTPKANPFIVKEAPYPHPSPDEVVVKNYALAINPCDYMLQDTAFLDYISYPNIFGVDVAGEVVEVGSNVTDLAVGQRVIGFDLTWFITTRVYGADF